MTTDVLKQRLITAVKSLAMAQQREVYRHWRGDGDGTDENVPCIALLQYARVCPVGDQFLSQVLNAILHSRTMPTEIGVPEPFELDEISGCIVGRNKQHQIQFEQLVKGIAWTVKAEFCRRQAEKPPAGMNESALEQFRSEQTQQAFEALREAAKCYDKAWQVSTQKVEGTGIRPDKSGNPVVSMFMQRSRDVMTEITYSSWNVLERLLLAMQPAQTEPASSDVNAASIGRWSSRSNELTVLFYEAANNRGVLGPMKIELLESDFPAVLLDPLGFGITVLDDLMQNSIRAGYRCCRMSLIAKGTRTERLPAIRIIPQFPHGLQTFGILEGDSAGGLLAAGMIITADGGKIDRHRTATCAIAECRGDDLDSIELSELQLFAVGGISGKMIAVRESISQTIRRVGMVKANRDEWERHPNFKPTPTPHVVQSLGDLVKFLRGDTILEDELIQDAAIVHSQWSLMSEAKVATSSTQSMRKLNEAHRFDCFVPPRFSVEGPLLFNAAPEDAAENRQLDVEFDDQLSTEKTLRERPRVPVPGTGDDSLLALLKLSLLPLNSSWDTSLAWLKPGKSLVLYDRAGAGKTVATYRLCHVLAGPDAREMIFNGDSPLIVRIEGKWPEDDRGRPEATLRSMLIRQVAIDLSGSLHPSPDDYERATKLVDYALDQHRVVVVVDGFDQFTLGERQRIQNLMTAERSDGLDGCRWIVASRQHTINEMPDLFRDEAWLRVSIEPFSPEQQDEYFLRPPKSPIGDRWLKTIGIHDVAAVAEDHPDHELVASIRDSMNELLSLPMVLSMIRLLIEESKNDDLKMPMFQNISELYLLVSHKILERAIRKSRTEGSPGDQERVKTLVQDGIDRLHLDEPHQIRLLEYVLSLMAFQMMLLLETNGEINSGRYKWFDRLCRERFFRPITTRIESEQNRRERKLLEQEEDLLIEKWKWAIEVLKTIELNHQSSVDHHNDRGIAFRNRKMMECYAARYLSCFATSFDIFGTEKSFAEIDAVNGDEAKVPVFYKRPPGELKESESDADRWHSLCAWDFTTEDQWKPTWALCIDMPLVPPRGADASIRADGDCMRTSLSALFLQPKQIPGRDIRPTELIFRAWHRFELDDLLLCQRRFWLDGRFWFGQDLPVKDSENNAARQKQLRARLGSALIVPSADSVLKKYRDAASQNLRRTILERQNRILTRTGWVPIPENPDKLKQRLADWRSTDSNEKCLAFLQCPPATWIEAYTNGSRSNDPQVGIMGERDEQHSVRIEPFQMQATTVPRWMYRLFDPAFETASLSDYSIKERIEQRASVFDKYGDDGNFPIICTTHFDAFAYAKWLGPEFGLPTECEWEHACRAGTKTAFHFGDSLNGTEANCNGNYPWASNGKEPAKGEYHERTTPVGCDAYPCNDYGLFDVHGNVWEWCWDCYSRTWYQRRIPTGQDDLSAASDAGPAFGSFRVLRGGSWGSFAGLCRSAYRYDLGPDYRSNSLGFRLVVRVE